MPRRPPDFVATVDFLSPEIGGRKTQPRQGYRPDIRYDGDTSDEAWMVWPRFLDVNGNELANGEEVPKHVRANFYIVNEQLRKDVHLNRLQVNVRFGLVEGQRYVASCVVTELLSLHANAAGEQK